MKRSTLRRLTRYIAVVMILFCGLGVAGIVIPQDAATAAFCDTNTPTPSSPDSGFAGVFIDAEGVGGAPPEGFLANTGVGGFNSFTWDNGCDPIERANVFQMKETANLMTGAAVSITAMTDAVQRWSFSSDWIEGFLAGFGERIMDVLQGSLWVAFVALGLIIVTVILLSRARHGDLQSAAMSVGWVLVVLMVVGVVFAAPVYIAQQSQQMAGGVIGTLQGSPDDPAGGQTDQVMQSVHYNSWLRRTFGSESTAVAEQYGPAIFESVTFTFEEQRLMEQGGDIVAKALIESHADRFRDNAEAVCDADPSACRYLHGKEGRSGLAALELGFSVVANGFRLLVSLLMVVACILLVVLGVVWVVASPYLLNPRGEGAGRAMLNRSATAIGYVLIAAVGSYGFGVWSEIALAPGISTWLSALLLVAGTVLAWGLIRPDRKLLSLASNGKINGYGKSGGWLMDKAASFFITKQAVEQGVEDGQRDAAAAEAKAGEATEGTAAAHPTAPVVFNDAPAQPAPALGATPMPAYEPPGLGAGPTVADPRDDPTLYRRDAPTAPDAHTVIVMEQDDEGVYRRPYEESNR